MGGHGNRLHGHVGRALAAALGIVAACGARAQVAADTAAGLSLGTSVVRTGQTYSIAAGRQVGQNLFHSFRTFNLPGGETASFSGPAGIDNVIGRVTGGASSIDGTIQSTIAGASLWLINPSGIAFGPNARLDVQGSFHASTASYLKFGANGQFGMAGEPAATLTVNPTAFGFLGTPAAIALERSELKVPLGATLSLVGGDVTGVGSAASRLRLEAPGGRINLASVASPGEVTLGGAGIGVVPAPAPGSIALANAQLVTEDPSGTQAPGPIFIRSGRLTLEQSQIGTRHFLPGAGGDVAVALDGDFAMNGGFIRTASVGTGDAGSFTLRAANVTLSAGAAVVTSSFTLIGGAAAGGRAGRITVEAAGDVVLSGAGTGLFSTTGFNTSPAGETRVTARNLTVRDGAIVKTSTGGDGDAGRLTIAVNGLTISGGGQISADTEFNLSGTPGSGRGGDLSVSAAGTVDVDGTGSGIFSRTASLGRGGTVSVAAADIRVHDGGRISSESHDPAGLLGNLLGDAGSVNLSATRSIVLENDGAITTQALSAGGGIINLRAGDTLALSRSRITTSVGDGTGNGGDINIDPVFVVLNNSQILAQ
ncbi:MAG: hypothetical protein A3G83_13525, partial [Betaproteobacteria bacterium RIFCSPLOWO2_12_FULL_68_20]